MPEHDVLREYMQVIETVPYGVTINDLEGRYVMVNQAFCGICGHTREDVLSMHYTDLTYPDDVSAHLELDKRLRQGNIPYFQLKKRYLNKDGQQKHCLLQVSLIRDEELKPSYYYGQILDVTDLNYFLNDPDYLAEYLKRVDELPEQQRSSSVLYEVLGLYRKLNQSKNAHLAFIAHELRNPLQAIQGLMPLIQKSVAQQDSQKSTRLTHMVEQSCERMGHMVDGLLDMTCIETGNLVPKRAEFDLIEMVMQLIQSLEGMSQEHNIELGLICENSRPFVIESDETRIWEVLANLLSNGIKYTQKGKVEVHLKAQGKHGYLIQVIDTGIGIAEEHLQLIFEEYQKVPLNLNKQVSRAGLGLPITRRLVNMLGGEISVSSEPGKGSCFSVRFEHGRIADSQFGQ